MRFRFRRQFLRNWLFYELQPEHAWPKDLDTDEGRRKDWRFTATIEIQFENQRSRQRRLLRYLGDEEEAAHWDPDDSIPVDVPGQRARRLPPEPPDQDPDG